MDTRLEIFTLGGVHILQAGAPITGLNSRKTEALLIYLASARRPQPREALADLLWGERSSSHTMANLRGSLTNLRQVIGDSISISRYMVGLNPDVPVWLDSAVLQDCLEEMCTQNEVNASTAAQVSKALDLYQGDFLDGFSVSDCPRFQAWQAHERERLHHLAVDGLSELVTFEIEQQEYQQGMVHASRLLELDPLMESAHRQMMLLLVCSGQRAAALSQYENCQNQLQKELGVEPAAETRDLYEQIKTGRLRTSEESRLLPRGTVTFLFTDIANSDRLLEQLLEQYMAVLAEQSDLLRDCFQRWRGREVDAQGASFFVAFGRASDAINCAIEAQHMLVGHAWPGGVCVKVRMGLHTGEPLLAHSGYTGIDVHRATRIAATGYGGQVLLSQATRELICQDLPQGVKLRDLGKHKLRDSSIPQQIFQLDIEGLPCDFPALKVSTMVEEPSAPGKPPFKGLQFFEESDAELFFGRKEVTDRLVKAISQQRFLALVGASGSGKSSVVRAGVVPALKADQPNDWEVLVLTPTAQPIESLAVQLTRDAESLTVCATLLDDLRREVRSLYLCLIKLAEIKAKQHKKGKKVLLVVDQFEELFTQCRDTGERQAFIGNLLYAAQAPDGRVHVLITLRADFYEHLAAYTELRQLVAKHQEYLGAMSVKELRQAIEGPAKLGGWKFTPGLVELMLHEVGAGDGNQQEPGALPLLSHALLETWNHRQGRRMSLKSYADSGGVRRAIARTAERLYSQELSPEQQSIARNIFLRLTELGESIPDTRRRAALQELYPPPPYGNPKQVQEVLVKLADARLIITSEGTAEVAHKALIREWPTLREWLTENREGLLVQRRLTEAAQEWQLLERDKGALYRGARLVQALEWAQAHPQQLIAQEQAFLEASQETLQREEAEREAQRQRELETARRLAETEKRRAENARQLAEAERQRAEEQTRSTQRLRRRAVYLAIALVLAAVLAAASVLLGLRAASAARLATSRELTSAALNTLKIDSQLSAHLALQALQNEHTFEAENALHQVQPELHLLNSTPITNSIGSTFSTWTLARNGELFFNVIQGGIEVIDQTTGTHSLLASGENCRSILPSRDGRWLLVFCYQGDQQVEVQHVWEVATSKRLFTFPELGYLLSFELIPPTSTHPLLVFASYEDYSIHVWEVMSGKELFVDYGHSGITATNGMVDAISSPDGKRLATFDSAGLVILFDMENGQKPLHFNARSKEIWYAEINPDGTRFATIGGDNTIKLWDITSLTQEPRLLHEFSPEVTPIMVRFSPDGTHMAAGGEDGLIRLWDVKTGELYMELSGHAAVSWPITFSKDGKRLYTGALDSTLKEWDLSPSRELLTVSGRTGSSPFSPDGRQLAIAGADHSVSLLDSQSGEVLLSWIAHPEWITDIAWSPDGRRLATASSDNSAKIWDAATGQLIQELRGITRGATVVAWSPDAERVATGSAQGISTIWDPESGEKLLTLKQPNPDHLFRFDITRVVFSPDGQRIATSSLNKTATVWDAYTGRELFTLTLDHSAGGVAFSPDSQRLATSSGGSLILWKFSNGGLQQERVFAGGDQAGRMTTITFSPDGTLLASGDYEGKVRVWDLKSGLKRLDIATFIDEVNWVAFSPDGRRLVASSAGKTSYFYTLSLNELIELTRSRLLRPMTPEECQSYLHKKTCPPWP